jgi:hypothetical protein
MLTDRLAYDYCAGTSVVMEGKKEKGVECTTE